MHSRTARLCVLITAVAGLTAVPARPVQANTTKTIEITATMTLSGCSGLGYPGINGAPNPVVTTKPGPKGVPEENIARQGNHCDFEVKSSVCSKTSAGKKTGTSACTVETVGDVWGFCGFATAEGFIVIEDIGGAKGFDFSEFKATMTGGKMRVSGGIMEYNIMGELTAAPTTGSCATKTATGFTIGGVLHLKDCTNGTLTVNGNATGVCNP